MVETRGDGEATNATAGQGVGPENSNQINVSVKKNPNFYVFLGKKYLETHETIELPEVTACAAKFNDATS